MAQGGALPVESTVVRQETSISVTTPGPDWYSDSVRQGTPLRKDEDTTDLGRQR